MRIHKRRIGLLRRGDRGQVTIFVVIAMALFLIGFVGFAVDMTNLWFHRQMAQGAADAACQAGVMDVLLDAQGGVAPAPGFTAGVPFDCASSPSAVPCRYAVFNGYNGAGLIADTPSNAVSVTFPGTVPGTTPPPVAQAPVPYLRVDVMDRVGLTFAQMIPGTGATSDVHAFAECGLLQSKAPIPIIVLNPVCPHTFQLSGNPCVEIIGGPRKSVQVNSINNTAACSTNSAGCPTGSPGASCSGGGGSAAVDLTQGGPLFDGSRFGVWGGPGPGPDTFMSGFNTTPNATWGSPDFPIPDPYANLAPPPVPGPAPAPEPVGYLEAGCPDPAGCVRYRPGLYTSAIEVIGVTAIFDGGVYYITGDRQPASCSDPGTGCNEKPKGNCHAALFLGSNSIVRPSSDTTFGDGTTFYMSGSGGGRYGSVVITSNSGARLNDSGGLGLPLDQYFTAGASGVPPAVCPGSPPPAPGTPAELPATLDGNVLLGPCTGPFGEVAVDPVTEAEYPIRGMLFFQDRANNDPNGQANFQGGGSMLLAGTMYFHNCPNSLTTGCEPWPTDYNAFMNLQGNPGSSTRVVGNIITDQMTLAGNGQISMILDPNRVKITIRASLLR